MKKIKLIIEKNEEGYWGQLDKVPSVFCSGQTIEELISNSEEALELYYETISQNKEKYHLELVMDIQEFFKVNEYINITSLAKRIGMNSSLLRQYSKGIKYPSMNQVAKIEEAIRQIGKELINTELQPV